MGGGSGKRRPSERGAFFVGATALLLLVLVCRIDESTLDEPRAKGGPSRVHRERPPPARNIQPNALRVTTDGAGRLDGCIVGPGSKPIAGASACLAAVSGPPYCVWSGAGGRFSMRLPTPAAGSLYVSAAGYQSLRRSVVSLPREAPLILTLSPGSAAITGVVSDASGGPIAGAVVRATSELEGEVVAAASSGEDGSFRMDPPGSERIVFLHAEAHGYSGLPSKVSTPAHGLRLVLSAESSIVGRVVYARSREPVAGAYITATARGWPWRSPRTVRSAADGSFLLSSMTTGVYSVLAASERVRGEVRDVALGVAETSRELEIAVEGAVQLKGRVSVQGEPCSRATLSVDGPVTTQVTADGDGAVRVEGLLSGSYAVEVSCDGALRHSESIEVGAEPMTRFWNLERGLRVRGVARSASGVPLGGARIDVDSRAEDKPNSSCVTDEHGRFSCTGLVAGDYDCTIAGPAQSRSPAVHVSLLMQSDDWIELRADPAGAIRVRIEGSDEVELASAPLMAYRQGASPALGQWDADELVFEPLGLGRYEIRSDTAPPGSGAAAELAHDGQMQTVTLRVTAHRLSGRVVDAAGMAVPDVWVRAESASPHGLVRPSAPVLSDEWGGFSLSGLLPGRYRVSAVSRAQEAFAEAHTDSTDALIRFQHEDEVGPVQLSNPLPHE